MIQAKNFNTLACTNLFYMAQKESCQFNCMKLLHWYEWEHITFFQEKDFSQVLLLLSTVCTGLSLNSVEQNAKVRTLSRDNLATQHTRKILEHDTLPTFFVNVFHS